MITKVTTSQMRCFKACRKRYELEYIEGLKPIEEPKPLAIGSMYHSGLELLLQGVKLGDVIEAVIYDQEVKCDCLNIDVDYFSTYIAVEMIKAFAAESGYQNWQILAVEKQFEVSTGYAKRLCGKIDGLILNPEDNERYLIEHKTTSQWGEKYLENLLWDEQSTNYLYAYNQMLEDGIIEGRAVKGIFYNIIEKPTIKPLEATPVEKRKYTKDGRLYAGHRETPETPEEFRQRVQAWYAEKSRLHLAYVYRTPADIKAQIDDVNLTIKDMIAAERDKTFYRNPESCKILPCPYKPKCLDNVPDTDCLFTLKKSKNEELLNNETL